MLLTACDSGYLTDAKTLLRSCARHMPDQRFYLFLVNADVVSDTILRQWHPHLIIERVKWPYEPSRWRGIMCSARSIPLRKALEEYGEPVIYLDTDILVRGSLSEIFQELEHCDLMVRYRPDLNHIGAASTPFGSTFNSGVIAVRPSQAGLRFVREYDRMIREYIASGKPLEVFRPEYRIRFVIDQELLYVAYQKVQDEIIFKPLPMRFNDARFHPTSLIWHGKGSARRHPVYVVERLRYVYPILYQPYGLVSGFLNHLRRIRRYVLANLAHRVPTQ